MEIWNALWFMLYRGPSRFEGDRPRFGDKDGYRAGPRGEFGDKPSDAPPAFKPSFRVPFSVASFLVLLNL